VRLPRRYGNASMASRINAYGVKDLVVFATVSVKKRISSGPALRNWFRVRLRWMPSAVGLGSPRFAWPKEAIMKSPVPGPSDAVDEHETGAGFEGELWMGFNTIVHARHITMSELVFAIRSAAKATSPQAASPYSPPVAQWWPRYALRPQR
jgi:hypothetical protein